MKKTNGDSKESVSISMSISLASRLSKYCFKKDLQVSSVVSTAVKRFLAAEMAVEDVSFWDEVYDKYEQDGKL